MNFFRVIVATTMLVLLSAVIIRGIITGAFDGPWAVLGPLAAMSLAFILGEGAVQIGKEGVQITRKKKNNNASS